MAKIKVLSEEVANRIAAGEVIERPVSVVKELVENSIDSGADKITIAIENGGKSFIQVSDNGCGMNEDDAFLCFERHATSKIRTVNDIFHINTLGFRGEALPSIASISRLTLITKEENDELATQIEFDSGKLINMTKTASNAGTTITVKNLFKNVPARKKFLKSDQVEYKHILKYIHYQALLHPEIHFKLISNGREKINYAKTKKMINRLTAVLGNNFFKKDIIKIEDKSENISIFGFISGLEEQFEGFEDFRYLFLNGRFIRDKIIMHSIKQGYDPFVKKMRIYQQGKLPPFILFIEIQPELVDFNVHPAKLEIRFRDSQLVHFHIKKAITKALTSYEQKKFDELQKKITHVTKPLTKTEKKIYSATIQKPPIKLMKVTDPEPVFQPTLFPELQKMPILEEEDTNQNVAPVINKELNFKPEIEFVNPWQLHNTYILVQVEDGVLMIDQHAAHERIIYEKTIQKIHGAPATSQKLLFPLVLDIPPVLSDHIMDLISENLEVLDKIGFSLKTFSGNSIVVDEIPADLKDWQGGEIFIEILKQLQEEFEETEDFRDSIAKSLACKAAIKAGQILGKKEMLSLINDLFACKVPYFCPHGRPLIIKMTLNELERKFKRIER